MTTFDLKELKELLHAQRTHYIKELQQQTNPSSHAHIQGIIHGLEVAIADLTFLTHMSAQQ